MVQAESQLRDVRMNWQLSRDRQRIECMPYVVGVIGKSFRAWYQPYNPKMVSSAGPVRKWLGSYPTQAEAKQACEHHARQ